MLLHWYALVTLLNILKVLCAFYAPLMMMIVAVIVVVTVSVIRAGLITLTAIKISASILAPL